MKHETLIMNNDRLNHRRTITIQKTHFSLPLATYSSQCSIYVSIMSSYLPFDFVFEIFVSLSFFVWRICFFLLQDFVLCLIFSASTRICCADDYTAVLLFFVFFFYFRKNSLHLYFVSLFVLLSFGLSENVCVHSQRTAMNVKHSCVNHRNVYWFGWKKKFWNEFSMHLWCIQQQQHYERKTTGKKATVWINNNRFCPMLFLPSFFLSVACYCLFCLVGWRLFFEFYSFFYFFCYCVGHNCCVHVFVSL